MAAPPAQSVGILTDLIRPKPKQREFLRAMFTHKYVLWGGAAGPGKSYVLRWGLVYFLYRLFLDKGIVGARVGLFCETYSDLHDRQISKVLAEFPEWMGVYRDHAHEYTLCDALGGGVIAFRNLDDPSKFRSVEFAAIGVDELTMNRRETFELLRFRLRWVGVDHSPFLGVTNPTGPGHSWCKKLWIDRDFSGDDSVLHPEDFLFIPALPSDNDSLPTSYYVTLATLPPLMRAALLEGRWDTFAGQAFPEFRGQTLEAKPYHVVPYFQIPKYWARVGAHDWGYNEPCYTMWLARDPDGGVVVYKELWGRKWDGGEIARRILAVQGEDDVPVIWAGPDIYAEHRARITQEQLEALDEAGLTALSIADQYRMAGLVTMQPAQNSGERAGRKAGKLRLHTLMRERDDGVPWLRVMETCPILIKCLREIQVDPKDPEDVVTNYSADEPSRDEPYDALRYGVMSMGRTEVVVPLKGPQELRKSYDWTQPGQRYGGTARTPWR